jgi:hypothetical protein
LPLAHLHHSPPHPLPSPPPLQGADAVFAKTYRGDVLLTVIWFLGTGSFYVTLSPAGGEEQALVDTLFPAIYGKRRGVQLAAYEPPGNERAAYNPATDEAWSAPAARRFAADLESKLPETLGRFPAASLTLPASLFARSSVWESDGEVPDPDAIRARDEAFAAEDAKEDEGKEDDELDDDDDDLDDDDGGAGGAGAAAGSAGAGGPVVDVSGGNGYTQVYIVMQPTPGDDARTPLAGGGTLVSRPALFRFGSWVYGGKVEFPVESLRLGDVPYVLPALQKQQGRLGFVSEATAFPSGHALCGTISTFMAAVGVLRHQMEDAQEEVAALAEQSVNAWIDADWAASFFELSFVPSSVPGHAARAGAPGTGLAGAELIASKIYMFEGSGVILHCVWFGSSLFCVLADSVEDLPLLDVAFPDVTARNRVVQVRTYEDRTAKKLVDAFPGTPVPKALRVWEGRRKGVPGVGFGAASAMSNTDAAAAADAIRQKARERAERDAAAATAAAAAAAATSKPKAAAASESKAPEGKGKGGGAAAGGGAPAPAPAPAAAASKGESESKTGGGGGAKDRYADLGDDDDDNDDLYDVSGLKQSLGAAAAKGGAGGAGAKAGAGAAAGAAAAAAATSSSAASSMPTQLFNSVARAPHHVAPMNRGGPATGGRGGPSSSSGGGGAAADADAANPAFGGGNRLIVVGGGKGEAGAGAGAGQGESKDDAPWDASGKPRRR